MEQIPQHALLGNRMFLFQNDPAYFWDLRERLNNVVYSSLSKAQGQIGELDPPDGLFSGKDAYKTLNTAIIYMEDDLCEIAAIYSSAAWLWYLRRLPLFFFDVKLGELQAAAASSLAEIIADNFASIEATKPSNQDPLIFLLDNSVVDNLINFCGRVQALRVVHKRIRSAGKGVQFRKIEHGLPEPAPTESQRKALQKYDQRSSKYSILFGNSGTILYNFHKDLNGILLTRKSFFKYPIPVARSERFKGMINDLHFEIDGNNYLVPGTFKLIEISIPHLTELVKNHLSAEARDEVAQIYMLLYLVKQMLRDNPEYVLLQTLQTGYILDSRAPFLEFVRQHFQEVIKVAGEAIPEAKFPGSAENFFTNLSTLKGSTWPPKVGALIKVVDDNLLIDIFAASSRLDAALCFVKELPNGTDKERANHFELRVQQLLERTRWRPKSPAIEKLIGVKLRRKAGNRSEIITDVDAIGEKDNILLVVECKSILDTSDNVIGAHSFARNRAEKLETYVLEARKKEAEINDNLVGANYDVHGHKVIIVICTPNPVYTELGLVRSCSSMKDVNELGSIQEILPGLSAAVSFIELEYWLESN